MREFNGTEFGRAIHPRCLPDTTLVWFGMPTVVGIAHIVGGECQTSVDANTEANAEANAVRGD